MDPDQLLLADLTCLQFKTPVQNSRIISIEDRIFVKGQRVTFTHPVSIFWATLCRVASKINAIAGWPTTFNQEAAAVLP